MTKNQIRTLAAKSRTVGEFKIESGIEIPSAYKKKAFPFDEMAAGDSIEVAAEMAAAARSAAYSHSKKSGMKVVTRTTEKGVRIWMVYK